MEGKSEREKLMMNVKLMPMLMGKCAGAIDSVEPAAKIIADMVNGAVDCINAAQGRIARL